MPRNQNSPPRPDEFELSVFGPGYGECLVAHLGNNSWMVVDSCPGQKEESVAVEYLDSLGLRISECVKLVVASHWHDDHVQGLASVVRYCKSAKFACSAALQADEFFALLIAGREAKLVEHSSGTAEFAEILEVLEARQQRPSHFGPDYWASESQLLLAATNESPVEVFALSPSAQTITDAKLELGTLIPSVGEPTRRIPPFTPNHLSVALLLKTPGLQLLLGGDLEASNDPRRGWLAVINSALGGDMACQTYKVAHHGSPDADHNDIWNRLLTTPPIALLTPYSKGRSPRPTQQDIDRIKSRGAATFCTTWPPNARNKSRRGIESTIREVTKTHRTLPSETGHIRLRVPLAGPCHSGLVEVLEGAVAL